MSASPGRPPAFWRAIVRALLPASRRDEVEGDLIEGWRDRVDATRWRRAWTFWRDAASLVTRRRKIATESVVLLRTTTRRGWLQDIRAAWLVLARRPGFTALAVITLAIGIAASVSVFTIADRVLLRPLPFPEPDRLVAMAGVPSLPIGRLRAPEFDGLEEFAALGTYSVGGLSLGEPSGAAWVRTASVGARFFDVLGVRPIAGRVLTVEDGPSDRLAVLAFDAWHRFFGGELSMVGRQIRLNGQAYTVVGVMPRTFRFPADADVWLPVMADTQASAPSMLLPAPQAIGRLRPGVSLRQAESAVIRADDRRRESTRASPRRSPITVIPLQQNLARTHRTTLMFLVMVVALLLVATCANVAGLMLARLRARERELLTRAALGAGRWRLVRQLGAEAALLTAAGAVVGLTLGIGLVDLFAARIPIAGIENVAVDMRIVAIGLTLCAMVGLVVTASPAWTASRADPAALLRGGSGGSSRLGWVGRAIVVGQISTGFMLLTATTVSLASLARLAAVDLGFTNPRALAFELTLPSSRYGKGPGILDFFDRLRAQLLARPGVLAVGATNVGPKVQHGRATYVTPLQLVDRPVPPVMEASTTSVVVTSDFFRAVGVPLIAGRYFSADDGQPGGPRAVILSASAARKLGPDVHALVGQRLDHESLPAEIVGIVRDVRMFGPVIGPVGELYEPLGQSPDTGSALGLSIVLDGVGETAALIDAVSTTLHQVDPDLAIYNVFRLGDLRSLYLPTERLTLAVTSAFSTIALLLSAVGLYGVLSQVVARRTREVGIRIALGADVAHVRRSVFAAGLRLAVAGIVIGSASTYLAFKAAAAFLPRLDAPSLEMFAVNALVLLTVAMLAAWVPARRAAAVDPVHALRAE